MKMRRAIGFLLVLLGVVAVCGSSISVSAAAEMTESEKREWKNLAENWADAKWANAECSRLGWDQRECDQHRRTWAEQRDLSRNVIPSGTAVRLTYPIVPGAKLAAVWWSSGQFAEAWNNVVVPGHANRNPKALAPYIRCLVSLGDRAVVTSEVVDAMGYHVTVLDGREAGCRGFVYWRHVTK